MNTRHLSLFLQVAKSGSMTKAAEELKISQPAISAQIKRLEEELGVPLFSPNGRGVKLTDAGQACMEYAEALLGLESQLIRAMDEFREGKRGRIVVAAAPSIGTYLMPKFLASFRVKHNGIEVDLSLYPDEDIERLVQDGHVDIGVTLAAPHEHFSLRVTRFVDDAWIGIQPERYRDSTQVFFAKDAMPPLIEKHDWNMVPLESTEIVKQYVLQGMGRGVVLRSSVTREMQSGVLQQWDDYKPVDTTMSLVTRPAEKLSTSLWMFIRHLQQASGMIT